WRFGSTPILGATNVSLIVSNVTSDKAGTYSVVISNVFGPTISANAILNLIPVPLCSNIVVAADSNCIANASIDAGSFDPEGGPLLVQQIPPGPYPLGSTPVTLYVSDNRGATNSCSALVTVLDLTPPQIVCPTIPIKPNDPHQCGAAVQFPLP